jgi:ribosome-associated protein
MMKTVEYRLTAEFVELNHLMKLCGFADSGGSGGALVASGVVSVDGKVELRKRNKIRGGQVVAIEDTEIRVLAGEGIVPKAPKVPAKPLPGKAQPYRPRRKPGAPKSGG